MLKQEEADEKMRRIVSGYQAEPPEKVWPAVEARLPGAAKKRPLFFLFGIFALVLGVLSYVVYARLRPGTPAAPVIASVSQHPNIPKNEFPGPSRSSSSQKSLSFQNSNPVKPPQRNFENSQNTSVKVVKHKNIVNESTGSLSGFSTITDGNITADRPTGISSENMNAIELQPSKVLSLSFGDLVSPLMKPLILKHSPGKKTAKRSSFALGMAYIPVVAGAAVSQNDITVNVSYLEPDTTYGGTKYVRITNGYRYRLVAMQQHTEGIRLMWQPGTHLEAVTGLLWRQIRLDYEYNALVVPYSGVNANTEPDKKSISNYYNYINIPLNARYNFANRGRIGFYTEAGVNFDLLVNSSNTAQPQRTLSFAKSYSFTGGAENAQYVFPAVAPDKILYSANLGAGISWFIQSRLSLEAGAGFYINPFARFNGSKNVNYGLSLPVALFYHF